MTATAGLQVEGFDKLQALGAGLKEASDKGITNRVRSAIRDETKPAGLRILRAGAGEMPKRGGFSARVANQGRVGLLTALVSRDLHITMTLTNKGANMRALEAGLLRHPVFARADRRRVWVRQSVPAGAFKRAFEREAPRLRSAALAGAQAAMDDVARKV